MKVSVKECENTTTNTNYRNVKNLGSVECKPDRPRDVAAYLGCGMKQIITHTQDGCQRQMLKLKYEKCIEPTAQDSSVEIQTYTK